MTESGRSRGGIFGALLSAVVLLIGFAVFFNLFLILPFFVFLGGLIAMVASDWKRSRTESRPAATEDQA